MKNLQCGLPIANVKPNCMPSQQCADLANAVKNMQMVTIPGTRMVASKFILGTASLHSVGGGKDRHALLEAAIDHGFTHFDTAPYYGFGWAERDLAQVLKRHPHASVTTKVGIYSPGGETQPFSAMILRKAGGKLLPALSRPTISFNLQRASQALETSLARLERDHIELYMLHEPELDMLNTDEWLGWLQKMVASGKVGNFGIALTADKLEPFLKQAPELASVVQVLDSLNGKEADILERYGKPMQITYGYLSAALASGDTTAVPEILAKALERNTQGSIIVSTKKISRLAQYQQLAGTAQ